MLLLGLALALVFGISHLLGGSPEDSGNPSARPAAASVGSPTGARTPSATGEPAYDGGPGDKDGTAESGSGKATTPLAAPTGPCADGDIRVAPSVDGPSYAGQGVTITLNLTTVESPACSWKVSAASVVVKLTSGDDRIWSTQDCPAGIDPVSVVVRRDHVTKAAVTWSGQRSDDDCSRTTPWSQPGYYHVEAAALGADPQERQFRLLAPTAPTITATPKADRDAPTGTRGTTGTGTDASPGPGQT